MAKFMEIKCNNAKLIQSENAKLLELSSSTIQRYRKEIKMLSPCRIPSSSKSNQRKQKTPKTKLDDLKVTSDDLEMTSKRPPTNHLKKKNKLKGGANIENNEKYLDENCL